LISNICSCWRVDPAPSGPAYAAVFPYGTNLLLSRSSEIFETSIK
jgi:hypothetical protein